MNKKAMSAIVTTVIMVALALIAIGVVWVVINNLVSKGAEDVSLNSKCLDVSMVVSSVNCTDPAACEIGLSRNAGGEAIAGVKMVFYNATGSSSAIDSSGNIVALETSIRTVDSTLTSPNKVDVTVYFEDGAGNAQLCPGVITKSFS